MIIEINNKQEFDNYISKGNYIVDFYATWCGPCKMIAPLLHELDEDNRLNGINILKIDVDRNEELSAQYSIQAVPTLFFMKNGVIVNKSLGYMGEDDILKFINK